MLVILDSWFMLWDIIVVGTSILRNEFIIVHTISFLRAKPGVLAQEGRQWKHNDNMHWASCLVSNSRPNWVMWFGKTRRLETWGYLKWHLECLCSTTPTGHSSHMVFVAILCLCSNSKYYSPYGKGELGKWRFYESNAKTKREKTDLKRQLGK